MKFYLTLFLASCMLIFSCESKKSAETQEELTPKPTIRMLTNYSGINDKSFNAMSWKGIQEFYNDTGKNLLKGKYYDFVPCSGEEVYVPTLRKLSEEGYTVILVPASNFVNAVIEVASEYPNQFFALFDMAAIDLPNVVQFTFAEEEGSFLVGMVAAMQAKLDGVDSPQFGFIGGIPGSIITRFEMGYIQGIKSIYPDAVIHDFYANDWAKPELAKEQAKAWFDSGVYAIFSAAGSTGNGTIAQAKEYRQQGKNVWAIGVDCDQFEDGLYDDTNSAVLTSMVKRVDTAAQMLLRDCKDFSLDLPRETYLGLAQQGMDYSIANPLLHKEIIEAVNVKKQEIISGKQKIYKTYAQALSAGIAPQGLKAIDD